MKQSTFYLLSLVALSNLVSSGVIRERATCYSEDGSEIPCVRVVEKAEDFKNSAPSKRWLFGNDDDDDFFNDFFGNNNGGRNTGNKGSNSNIFSGEFWDNLFGGGKEEEDWWNPANNVNPPTVPGNTGGDIFGGIPPTVNNPPIANPPANPPTIDTSAPNPPIINTPTTKEPPTIDTSTTKQPPTTNNGSGIDLGDLLAPIPEPSTKTIPPQALTTKAPPNKTSSPSSTKNLPTNISTKAPPTPQSVNNNNNNSNNSTPSSNNSGSKNLPIKKFTITGFTGCNAQQKQILEKLIEDIKTYRAGAVYLLNNINEDPNYQKIFDKYFKDPNAVAQVKKVFENVNNMEEAAGFCEPENETSCVEGAMAWTYLHSREFHVCPVFFREAMFGTIEEHKSEASSIVLHEMTHCYGTDDFAYGEQNIARLPAQQATNNADTYRLFSMSAVYYLKETKKAYKDTDELLNQIVDFRPVPIFKDKVLIREDKMVPPPN